MEKEQVANRIEELIRQTGKVGEHDLSRENIVVKLGLNSIEVLELLIGIESEFNITFEDEDLDPKLLESVGNLSEYVLRKMEQRQNN